MRLLIEIPDEIYKSVQDSTYCGTLYEELKNGIPQETVTEFADRCRECGREKVLDKIRAEIEKKARSYELGGRGNGKSIRYGLCMALEIVDKYRKYRAENEDKAGMRLIDADELMEHVWSDKLDSRELIVEMIENAPTIKEIPTNIPIDVFEQLLSMHVKTGHWIDEVTLIGAKICRCSECNFIIQKPRIKHNFCPNCGTRMESEEV